MDFFVVWYTVSSDSSHQRASTAPLSLYGMPGKNEKRLHMGRLGLQASA